MGPRRFVLTSRREREREAVVNHKWATDDIKMTDEGQAYVRGKGHFFYRRAAVMGRLIHFLNLRSVNFTLQ